MCRPFSSQLFIHPYTFILALYPSLHFHPSSLLILALYPSLFFHPRSLSILTLFIHPYFFILTLLSQLSINPSSLSFLTLPSQLFIHSYSISQFLIYPYFFILTIPSQLSIHPSSLSNLNHPIYPIHPIPYSIKLIELSRRHLINSSDVFVIKGFTVSKNKSKSIKFKVLSVFDASKCCF